VKDALGVAKTFGGGAVAAQGEPVVPGTVTGSTEVWGGGAVTLPDGTPARFGSAKAFGGGWVSNDGHKTGAGDAYVAGGGAVEAEGEAAVPGETNGSTEVYGGGWLGFGPPGAGTKAVVGSAYVAGGGYVKAYGGPPPPPSNVDHYVQGWPVAANGAVIVRFAP
jgi:hypothetical protein